ncbi:hypothetical protein K458DRAFT_396903 [Lentithecium fluviatile CBS 122367]|uniref:Uncharacterized protein n=1 Tax=Lentithecium fluviatile CBS 122367 TaxID=1168545 RepID=A0A6G1IEE2_9PLEO|nr:hypothetical protein K458DRAFT_396903 [Lentithecium fluviatile CBS 122367]
MADQPPPPQLPKRSGSHDVGKRTPSVRSYRQNPYIVPPAEARTLNLLSGRAAREVKNAKRAHLFGIKLNEAPPKGSGSRNVGKTRSTARSARSNPYIAPPPKARTLNLLGGAMGREVKNISSARPAVINPNESLTHFYAIIQTGESTRSAPATARGPEKVKGDAFEIVEVLQVPKDASPASIQVDLSERKGSKVMATQS